MYGKIQITGTMEIVTGTHIGGSSAFAAIGAVDSPIIRDVSTNLPMIPGSSLKGKMRTLLARQYTVGMPGKHDDDPECIIRLFGTSKKVNGKIPRGHILVSDMVLANMDELYKSGIQSLTEIKFENTINRLTAVANPRQIERVIRGSKFPVDIIYEVDDEEKVVDDISLLAEGMKLVTFDYIGGNGSRGYGKVKFDSLHADCVIGEVSAEIMEEANRVLVSI